MKNLIFRGSGSRIFWVFLPDSTSTTGGGKTGLTSASGGLNVTVRREKSTSVTTYTSAGSTTETITTLGTYAAPTATKVRFKEVDSTNLPGIYELQFADALFDTSDTSRWLSGMITATGVAPTPFELPLVAVDLQDAVRMAMTALPNAAAEAAGGLYTRGTGVGQINQAANGMIDTNPVRLNNVSQSLLDLKDFADDGYDPATNKVQGVVLTDTVTTYTGNTLQTGDNYARLGAPAGASIAADIATKASQTSLDTLDDYVDTEVGAIKTKTDQLTFTTANKIDATIQVAGDFAQAAADKVWLTTSRTLSAFGFSVTVGTNNDKTGYTLSAAGIQAIWDALTSALTTVGSIGKLLVDNINATISSRSSHTAGDVWAVATRILTAGTNIVLAKGTGVTGFNDLSAAQVNAEVDTALADYDAPTSSELVSEINSVQADIAALNNLSASVAADAVWDEVLAGHLTAGSTGAALNAAGSAGDPWTTALPGAYGAGSAGKIVGDNINATISSRSSHSAADVWAVGTRTLTSFGTLVADIWAAVTRTLTAGTNIVLAKGVGVTGFNDLSAAQVNSEADTALVDYDPPTRAELTSDTNSILSAISTVSGFIDTEITTILNRIGAFTGTGVNTILGFFQALMRKDATTPSDLGGAYDDATDSLEAIRDRGDVAWLTATGFSTLSQADVRTAVGLASANLDTQLGAIDDFLDTEVLAIKAKTDNLPVDPADASDIAASFASAASSLATVAGYIDTEVGVIKGVTDKLDTTLEADGLVYRFTINALEQAPAGGGGGGGTGLINFVYGGEWVLNQQNRIDFYLQSSAGAAVAGLGAGFTLTLAKNGGAFAASAGTKAEIGDGWYTYLATAGEANAIGTIAAKVVGAGAVEQNLEYVVKQRTAGAIAYTYTVTNSVTTFPVEGVAVWITTDIAGGNVIWVGTTDIAGVSRDSGGSLPYLDPGVYFFWKQKSGFVDAQNPDQETVS